MSSQQLPHMQAQVDEAREQLRRVYMEQAAISLSANRHEVVTAARTQLRALGSELAKAEVSACSSRHAEASALSVARIYRGFAAQGVSYLDGLQNGLLATELRLQRHVEQLKHAAQFALRKQNLRVILGAMELVAARAVLHRWQRFVVVQHYRSLASGHLYAALRHEAMAIAQPSQLSGAKASTQTPPLPKTAFHSCICPPHPTAGFTKPRMQQGPAPSPWRAAAARRPIMGETPERRYRNSSTLAASSRRNARSSRRNARSSKGSARSSRCNAGSLRRNAPSSRGRSTTNALVSKRLHNSFVELQLEVYFNNKAVFTSGAATRHYTVHLHYLYFFRRPSLG